MQLTQLWQSLSTNVSESRRKRVYHHNALRYYTYQSHSCVHLSFPILSFRLSDDFVFSFAFRSRRTMDLDIYYTAEHYESPMSSRKRSKPRTTEQAST
jgi:hypothetical protein